MMPIVIPCLFLGLPFLIWLIYRDRGYKRDPLTGPPGPHWVQTSERFADPTSGDLLDVWLEHRSGERAYVRVAR